VRVPAGSCGKIRTPAGSRWGGTLRQTHVTQRLRTAANSCGKVRNPAPTAENPISSARPRSPDKCIVQDASSIPICGIEPASAMGQGNRTGRAIFGRRAELAVFRFASRLRIRRTAWSWWNARNASVTALSTNVAVVWPSAGAETMPSGMSRDQPLAARNPLTMCEKYGHAWSRCASSMVTIFPVNSHSTRP